MPVVRHFLQSKMLVWLFILCLSDALFTDIGLRLSFIEEMNPLIRSVYEWHVFAYYCLKLVLPLLLMAFYPYIRKRAWVKPCLSFTVIIYGAVNVVHFIWLSYGLKYFANS
ncbi:DUF5658 family protein [Paenibacillus planticolens]|uniref:DUF5658 domain-containing protein n=1 Tax=Paenibacillus planticolens TaxID=2654976 RepID=A0ABX1ZQ02_9BACL|nr:DUF5658 family protein [Paenibacillus planticolens]NOV01733.1 hypothetical protein [Paenibacillus planticolens]